MKAHRKKLCRNACGKKKSKAPYKAKTIVVSHFNKTQKLPFCQTRAWLELRYKAIQKYGRTCMNCRATNCEIHVDHIKPKFKYPELALSLNNLQILCRDCNLGKGAWDETDFRGIMK